MWHGSLHVKFFFSLPQMIYFGIRAVAASPQGVLNRWCLGHVIEIFRISSPTKQSQLLFHPRPKHEDTMDGISKDSCANAFHTSLMVDSGCEQTDFYFDVSDSECEKTEFYDELETSSSRQDLAIDDAEPSAYHLNISTHIYPDVSSRILSSKVMMPLLKTARKKHDRTKPKMFKKLTSKRISTRSSASTVVHGEGSSCSYSFFSSFNRSGWSDAATWQSL